MQPQVLQSVQSVWGLVCYFSGGLFLLPLPPLIPAVPPDPFPPFLVLLFLLLSFVLLGFSPQLMALLDLLPKWCNILSKLRWEKGNTYTLQNKNNSFLKYSFFNLSLFLQNEQNPPSVTKQHMLKSTSLLIYQFCFQQDTHSTGNFSMIYSIRGTALYMDGVYIHVL